MMKDLRGQARVSAFLRKSLAEGAQDVLKLEAMARREALLGERQRITDAKAFKRAKYSLRIRSARAGFGPNGSNSRLPMVTVIRPSRARCVGTRACSLQSRPARDIDFITTLTARSRLRCGLRGKPSPTARTGIEYLVKVAAWLKWTHAKSGGLRASNQNYT